MAKQKRRRFTAEFKAEIVLEALSSETSQTELCRRYNLSDDQLSKWKQQFLENAASLFESRDKASEDAFVRTYETLFLGVKETEASDLTKTGHPLGWLLTVLQQEHADMDAIKRVLLSALSYLNSLDVEQTQQRERAILYLLLVLHQRPAAEHASLISLIDGQTHGMEVESMTESIIEQTRKQGLEQGLEQGETRAKREAILKLLQFRFDAVPEVLTRKIAAMQNRSLLDSLFEKAATAQTLDDIDWENADN